MLEFIQQYWTYIITGILVILDIILIFIKKRPQIIDSSLISKLILWIQQAEHLFRNGSDKLNYVLSLAAKELGGSFDKKEVTSLVEMILSLPSKKEK